MFELISMDDIYKMVFFFVKFGKREHLESLQLGDLYMRNAKYYNDLENKQQEKGQGDINDGKLVLADVGFKIFDQNNKLIHEVAPSGRYNASLSSYNSDRYPMLCLFAVTKDNIKEEKETKNSISFTFAFSPDQKDIIKKQFPDADSALVILNMKEFLEKLSELAINNGAELIHKKVRYSGFEINRIDRINDCIKNLDNVFFWKDIVCESQQEYRFLYKNIEIDSEVEYPIGALTQTNILDIDSFFNNHYILEYKTVIK